MERYINVGKLINDIEENKRNTEHHKDGRGKQIHVGEHRHFLKMVHEQPTADVVPKSEVEELKAIIKDHQANEERWQELYADTVNKWEKAYEELEIELENAKIEIAKEIITIIEQRKETNTEHHKGVTDRLWQSIYTARDHAYQDIKEIIEQKYI